MMVLNQNNILSPATEPQNSLTVRILAAVLLVGLLGALFWVLWLFFSPTKTVTLKEGAGYSYSGYSITLEKVTSKFCPWASDVDCANWLNELGAQIRYTSPKINGVNFDYLGIPSKTKLDLPDLGLELVSVDINKKIVKLKLTKK